MRYIYLDTVENKLLEYNANILYCRVLNLLNSTTLG